MNKNISVSFFAFKRRKGGLGFYALLLLLTGLGLATFLFFPEYINMQSGIYSVSCNDIRAKIESAVEDYNVNHSLTYSKPGQIVDLDTLKEKGYLREIKYCPQKGIFIFDEKGKVICSFHSKGK